MRFSVCLLCKLWLPSTVSSFSAKHLVTLPPLSAGLLSHELISHCALPWRRSGKTHPLWPYGSSQRGARFTPLGGFATYYLASDIYTASAEVLNQLWLPGSPPPPVRHPPLVFFTIDGMLERVLDLTDGAIQAAVGSSLAELTGDWPFTQAQGRLSPTQLLAQVAFDTGTLLGSRSVSSKNPPGTGVAVFADRLIPGQPSRLRIYDPYGSLVQDIP
ncbi:MAG: RES family NAD+ phosphorylase [Dehalococcoidia bacterium]